MKLIVDNTDVAAIRDLAEARLRQLDLVGRPAPAIRGVDIDRKPIAIEPGKGEVILVVFWATWCVPNAQEMPWLEDIYRRYGNQGLRIVGVNLDAPPGRRQDAAIPNIRRFLLDFNVTWPNLLNGQNEADLARAFGVREIPANVLIGRDGKVAPPRPRRLPAGASDRQGNQTSEVNKARHRLSDLRSPISYSQGSRPR